MKRRAPHQSGFSMVEAALALGIASFALMSVLALLPVGVHTNKVSADESRAANILTLLETDLRNSFALNATGGSQLFGLTTPYLATSPNATTMQVNSLIATTSGSGPIPSGQTVGLDSALSPQPISSAARHPFQATVIYTKVPSTGSLTPVEARLIVSWPALAANPRDGTALTIADLTDLSVVHGYVQALVTFAVP